MIILPLDINISAVFLGKDKIGSPEQVIVNLLVIPGIVYLTICLPLSFYFLGFSTSYSKE